jgi:uncharacterized protein YhdP
MKLTKRAISILVVVVVLLIGLRIALPYIVLNYANKVLKNDLEGYTGSIDDVSMSLYRGAYGIDSLKILKLNGKSPVPFVSVDHIDFSIEWRALLKGAVVAEVTTVHPALNFVDGPTEAQQQTGEEGNWQQVLDELFPLKINQWKVENGEVRFRNFSTQPKVDLHITNMNLVARNLRNSYKDSEQLPASVEGSALVLGDGKLNLNARLNPLKNPLAFDFNLQMTNVSLPKLNNFLEAYGGFDVEKGKLEVYTEVKGSENKFQGYVKPLLTDVKVIDETDKMKKPRELVWEGVVGLTNMIFKNWNKDRLATRVPIEGDLSDPEVDTWKTIVEVLRNAFIEAIQPGLEGKVDLSTVGDNKDGEAPTELGRRYDKAERKVEEAIKSIVK